MWNIPANLPFQVDIVDMRKVLPVNPKGGWEDFKEKRDIKKLTRIILHHDAVYHNKEHKAKVDKYTDNEVMTSIANTHIRSTKNRKDGDGGFPYHIFIRSGKVYIANNMEAFTYGVANNNGYTIHICVHGNYVTDKKGNHVFESLNEENKLALIAAIIMAKGSMPSFHDIKGHGEITPTDCPGYSVKDTIVEVEKAEKEIEASLNTATAAERAYKIANQILYNYNMFAQGTTSTGAEANEGQRSWALQQVLKLEPEMKRLGLLK